MENLVSHSSKTDRNSDESLQADLIQMDEDLARMLPKVMTELEVLPELQRIKEKIRQLLSVSD
jgi:hypothetical protein